MRVLAPDRLPSLTFIHGPTKQSKDLAPLHTFFALHCGISVWRMVGPWAQATLLRSTTRSNLSAARPAALLASSLRICDRPGCVLELNVTGMLGAYPIGPPNSLNLQKTCFSEVHQALKIEEEGRAGDEGNAVKFEHHSKYEPRDLGVYPDSCLPALG